MSKTFVDPKKTRKILERYPEGDSAGLIHALQDIQAEFGYVPREAAEFVCQHLNVPISKVFSVSTFYKAFSLEPKSSSASAPEPPAISAGPRPWSTRSAPPSASSPARPPRTAVSLSKPSTASGPVPWRPSSPSTASTTAASGRGPSPS
jgi:hypothetical protein